MSSTGEERRLSSCCVVDNSRRYFLDDVGREAGIRGLTTQRQIKRSPPGCEGSTTRGVMNTIENPNAVKVEVVVECYCFLMKIIVVGVEPRRDALVYAPFDFFLKISIGLAKRLDYQSGFVVVVRRFL